MATRFGAYAALMMCGADGYARGGAAGRACRLCAGSARGLEELCMFHRRHMVQAEEHQESKVISRTYVSNESPEKRKVCITLTSFSPEHSGADQVRSVFKENDDVVGILPQICNQIPDRSSTPYLVSQWREDCLSSQESKRSSSQGTRIWRASSSSDKMKRIGRLKKAPRSSSERRSETKPAESSSSLLASSNMKDSFSGDFKTEQSRLEVSNKPAWKSSFVSGR